jgi:hypothetical protein
LDESALNALQEDARKQINNESVDHKGDDAPDPIGLSAALLHDSVDTADRVLVGHR